MAVRRRPRAGLPGTPGRPRGAPALDEALSEGDELVAAAGTERALRQEGRTLRRDLADRDKRFGWLERAVEAQRTAKETAERDRDVLAAELAELKARLRVPVSGTRPVGAPSPASPPPSRAERRRQEREGRRD